MVLLTGFVMFVNCAQDSSSVAACSFQQKGRVNDGQWSQFTKQDAMAMQAFFSHGHDYFSRKIGVPIFPEQLI